MTGSRIGAQGRAHSRSGERIAGPSRNFLRERGSDGAADDAKFCVDPYQFHEVIRPKLPRSEENNLDGREVGRGLREWFAQLGVEMNEPGKSMFWHDDGRLLVRASSADVNTIEAAIIAMGKEYSGKPHPPHRRRQCM